MQRRTATGEAKVHPCWVTSSLWLCFSIYVSPPRPAAGTSTPWRRPLQILLRTWREWCCEVKTSWRKSKILEKDIATVGLSWVTFFLDWPPSQCCKLFSKKRRYWLSLRVAKLSLALEAVTVSDNFWARKRLASTPTTCSNTNCLGTIIPFMSISTKKRGFNKKRNVLTLT